MRIIPTQINERDSAKSKKTSKHQIEQHPQEISIAPSVHFHMEKVDRYRRHKSHCEEKSVITATMQYTDQSGTTMEREREWKKIEYIRHPTKGAHHKQQSKKHILFFHHQSSSLQWAVDCCNEKTGHHRPLFIDPESLQCPADEGHTSHLHTDCSPCPLHIAPYCSYCPMLSLRWTSTGSPLQIHRPLIKPFNKI